MTNIRLIKNAPKSHEVGDVLEVGKDVGGGEAEFWVRNGDAEYVEEAKAKKKPERKEAKDEDHGAEEEVELAVEETTEVETRSGWSGKKK